MKRIQIALLLSSVFLLSFASIENLDGPHEKSIIRNQQDLETFMYLEITGENGGGASVLLNDIPVSKLSLNRGGGYGNAVTLARYYVKPGMNTISVYPLSKKGKSTIRLVNYVKGEVTGGNHGEELIEIVIEDDDGPVHKEVELSSDRKRWPWLDVDIITDDESKEEAIRFAKEFYKIMEQNNIKEMISGVDPLLVYELMCKPKLTKAELVEKWIKGMENVFTDENVFDDIDTISIELIPIANGKLFEVKRKDGSMLFRTSDSNEFVVGFKSIIGRKDGVWKFYH